MSCCICREFRGLWTADDTGARYCTRHVARVNAIRRGLGKPPRTFTRPTYIRPRDRK